MIYYDDKPRNRLAYEYDPDLSPYLDEDEEDGLEDYDDYDCVSDYFED